MPINTVYTPIQDNEVAPGVPVTSGLTTRLRDNPFARAATDFGMNRFLTGFSSHDSLTTPEYPVLAEVLLVGGAGRVFQTSVRRYEQYDGSLLYFNIVLPANTKFIYGVSNANQGGPGTATFRSEDSSFFTEAPGGPYQPLGGRLVGPQPLVRKTGGLLVFWRAVLGSLLLGGVGVKSGDPSISAIHDLRAGADDTPGCVGIGVGFTAVPLNWFGWQKADR